MIEELAKVIDYQAGWVKVEIKVKNACGHCDNSDNCGTSAVSKAFSNRVQVFSLPTKTPYQQGDILRLGLPENVLLKATALVYLAPLLALLVGAMVADYLAAAFSFENGELLSIVAGIVGGFIGWRAAKIKAAKMDAECQPVILGSVIACSRLD